MNDASSPAAEFLSNLRSQTGPEHKSLEEEPVSLALQSEHVSNQDYRIYLEKMYALFAGLEADIFPKVADVIPDLHARKKLAHLSADLKSLGNTEENIANIQPVHFTVNDKADALAIMYVLEGSTMGGRILYKHVNKHLQKTLESGAAFFGGYGEKTGSMWKAFLDPFTKYAVEQRKEDAIIAKAKETFLKVKEAMAA